MELDELKSAWQILDKKISREYTISLASYHERKLEQARSSLQPLRRGQIIQLLAGCGVLIFAVLLWSTKPTAISVIVAGVVVHLYGIASIGFAGVVLGGIHGIDYSEPVLEIQQKLAKVRKAYILGGIFLGLPWWFLWVPFLMVLAGLGGVNLYANAPSFVWINLGVGALGLVATWCLYSYSRDMSRPRLNRWVDNAITGRSLRRVQQLLEELRKFEQE